MHQSVNSNVQHHRRPKAQEIQRCKEKDSPEKQLVGKEIEYPTQATQDDKGNRPFSDLDLWINREVRRVPGIEIVYREDNDREDQCI